MIVHNHRQAAPFVGRVSEIDEIIHRLNSPGFRMLSLVGPGGIGKTRLAMRVAADCVEQFDDGVYFDPLQPVDAHEFIVSAVDQRGIGLSDIPAAGYDTATQANDMIALMHALGYGQFAVIGHDTGFTIGYALAADRPERIQRVVLAEIPRPPAAMASPPVFVPGQIYNRLWHIPFNRVEKLPEQLITGREDVFFGYEFAIHSGTLSQDVINYYASLVSNPASLRGGLGWYRAFDATLAQNAERGATPLPMPVLAIGGELSYGSHVGEAMTLLANDVQSVVIPGTGHWIAEEAFEEMLAALAAFLAPYLEGTVAA